MTIRFNPPSGWPQKGRAFNHGIVAGEGRTLYITGQVAWDEQGTLVGAGDCEQQIRKCFENVEKILDAVGGELADIVSLTIYFLDPRCPSFKRSARPGLPRQQRRPVFSFKRLVS